MTPLENNQTNPDGGTLCKTLQKVNVTREKKKGAHFRLREWTDRITKWMHESWLNPGY